METKVKSGEIKEITKKLIANFIYTHAVQMHIVYQCNYYNSFLVKQYFPQHNNNK